MTLPMARRGCGRAMGVPAAAAMMCAALLVALLLTPFAAAAAGRIGGATARTAAGTFSFTTRPGLAPQFSPSVYDYVTRCEPVERVTIRVTDTNHTQVSVDEQPVGTSSYSTTVKIGGGQRFLIKAGAASYSVACLPADFPPYQVQINGPRQAAYYLVTPTAARTSVPEAPYVVLFDRNGVPVWWYRDSSGSPIDAELMPNGDVSWYVWKNLFDRLHIPALTYQMQQFGLPPTVSQGFNVPTGIDLVEHGLNGALVSKLDTVGPPTDFHEGLPLPGGDFLMTSYALRPNADLAPLVTGPANALDAAFQIVAPNGNVVYSWSAAGKISPAETEALDHGFTPTYVGADGPVWDYQHIDSVAPDGDGYLISLAHTGAVYLIRASDGSVEWKLGGTTTPQSLTILGDPAAASDFNDPSDARVWPDGTISLVENATGTTSGPPRVLRFLIDAQARTATLIQTLTDPLATSSDCCGSARLLPGGDWVVAWGSTGIEDELTAEDQPVLRLTFGAPYYSYRAVPILPGELSLGALQAGMDAMTPRIPSGARPPGLSALTVSYSGAAHQLRVRFRLGWRAKVRLVLVRCIAVSHRGACARVVRIEPRLTRAASRGRNTISLGGPMVAELGAGVYRLTATPVSARGVGRPRSVTFRRA